ncbi:MAG: thiamine pyrophosphate-dependent enzyme [Deinococcales bacterium]
MVGPHQSPQRAALRIAQAFAEMDSGRPLPTALEVPLDVLELKAAVNCQAVRVERYQPPLGEELEAAVKALAKAKKPLIFVGSGALNVSREVKELAEMLQAPVVAYRTGLGILDSRHYLSLHQPPAKRYWPEADVVLAIGSNMRVPMQKWFKQHPPKIIRLDVDPLSHLRFNPPAIAITARAEEAMPLLLARLSQENPKRASRRDELLTLKAWWQQEVSVLGPQLSYLQVIREALGEDGIFVDEMTQIGFASRIAMPVYKPRSFITTGYQGTLGYGFPTALGVKLARPDVPVISINGDGGFMFAVAELATAVQHQIPLISLVFNNGQYGNVQQMQRGLYQGRVIATDLVNPDFVKLAESFGLLSLRAESPEALAKALALAQKEQGPSLIEIPIGDVPSVDRFR